MWTLKFTLIRLGITDIIIKMNNKAEEEKKYYEIKFFSKIWEKRKPIRNPSLKIISSPQ